MSLTPEELQFQIDHINDDRRISVVLGTIACGVIAYYFVMLRILAKRRSATPLKADDWAIFVALMFATGQYIDLALGVLWGLARHSILLATPAQFGQNLISAEVLYIWAIVAVKISILLLWHRLFTSKGVRIAIWLTGTLVSLMAITATLIVILQCIPMEHLWNPEVPGKCITMSICATVFGAVNILTDVLIILLPIKQLLKLRLEKRERLQLLGLFMTGGLVTIISSARMFYTMELGDVDVTWNYVDAGIWSSAEISAAIVSACLPTLRPLFSKRNEATTHDYHVYPSARSSQRTSEINLHDKNNLNAMDLDAKATTTIWVGTTWKDIA